MMNNDMRFDAVRSYEKFKGQINTVAQAVYADQYFNGVKVLRELLPEIIKWDWMLERASESYFLILESAVSEMKDADYVVTEEVVEALFWFYDQA